MSPTASTSPTFTIGELAREFDLTTRAIRFYEKNGYKIAGTQPYILGNDVQTDWIMTREIPLG